MGSPLRSHVPPPYCATGAPLVFLASPPPETAALQSSPEGDDGGCIMCPLAVHAVIDRLDIPNAAVQCSIMHFSGRGTYKKVFSPEPAGKSRSSKSDVRCSVRWSNARRVDCDWVAMTTSSVSCLSPLLPETAIDYLRCLVSASPSQHGRGGTITPPLVCADTVSTIKCIYIYPPHTE